MPDEIFLLSPCFGSCDTVKISSVIAVELHTLALFGVKFIAGYAARAKISHLLAKTRFGARIAIFGWLSHACHSSDLLSVPFVTRDNDHILARHPP